jgi:ribosomal protein L16 Arg81 hydroxylase
MSSPGSSVAVQRIEDSSASLGTKSFFPWLINPVSKEEFFNEYWENQPLVVKRSEPNFFGSLLTLDDVDRIISTLDLRYPDITLVNADRDITPDQYTVRGGSLDVAKIYELFGQGCTIILAHLHTLLPALTSFCRGMEREFSVPFQTNVYVTPANAKGFKPHYDTHDVFILQVLHSKRWKIYGTPVKLPLKAQEFNSSIHELGDPKLEFELNAGDIAYIPRGVVHEARSTEDVSLHVTVGVLSYTWTDLLLELVADKSLNDFAFRQVLPVGFARQGYDKAEARDICLNLLQKLLANPNFDVVLDRFIDELTCACPPLLLGQMHQMAALDHIALNSVVGARAETVFHLREAAESVSIECYGRKISFPSYAGEAVRFALTNAEFTVRDLPGGLDDPGKLVLVRRLIREGLVMRHENSRFLQVAGSDRTVHNSAKRKKP